MNIPDLHKEALRQQMLLRALWRDARPGVVAGWLRDGSRFERGLQAYQANGGALAERALGAAYPTVAELLGAESFALLARHHWRTQPPTRGDIAEWGAALPAFMADQEQLASEAYLPDVARLEWAVHQAERAADAQPPVDLMLLAQGDPERLRLTLQPGCAVIDSAYPVVSIWQAHRSTAPDRFVPVREALAEGRGESALVRRDGWKAQVLQLPAPEARFTAALLAQRPLSQALAEAGESFEFEPWLRAALQGHRIAGVSRQTG
jgi:hypothetical protein